MRRSALFDSLLVVCLVNSVLIWPLFGLEYLNGWASVDSTFIADARMLKDRLPHPDWQPLWYCGTRFDYIYPPALRYGTALISKLGGVSTARAYHFYTAVLYSLGIVSVYWLVRVWTRSRAGALLASAGVALFSPSFLLLSDYRVDSSYWVPQRLHSLMSYGEGPHISALSILPAALALSFLALRRSGSLAFGGASLLCAFTVANNFYGATALAIFFPILTWSVWATHREPWIWLRAAGIIALSYALSAVWLTPSYVRITVTDLRWVSHAGNLRSIIALLLAIAVFCAITWRWSERRPERAWPIFLAGSACFLSLYVLGWFYFEFRVAGEAYRLIPELDLALILVAVELIRGLWKHPKLRVLAILILMIPAYPTVQYLKHVYTPFPEASGIEKQYTYLISKWTHDHLPGERIMATGTVRFWFDAWFDNQQLDGGSMQGMQNQILPVAEYQIGQGDQGDLAVLWLQSLGTDAVIVPDGTSLEWYHDDFQRPEKFRGLAPILYDDQHGTVVYRIPRIYPGIGRTVEAARLTAIGRIQGGDDVSALQRYVAAIESPDQRPTLVRWISFEEMEVQAQVPRGQSVLLQETYDPAWHAYENGKPFAIRPEPVMGFMLVELPEGNHRIAVRFERPLENRLGGMISMLALAIVAALLVFGLRNKQPPRAIECHS
jgi:hypothetical protein